MLEWTGERYVPWVDDPVINYEHLHRYGLAKEFVKGKNVLDLASGEGYGSFMLSAKAHSVTGVDIDDLSIKHASSKYVKENLRFIEGSITDVPIKGENIFDVVVCFEALEHIEDHDGLLKEVKRLLKENGIFIVSTPNKYVYSDQPNYQNPFHLKELYFAEFKELLSKYFENILMYGQKVSPSSNIFPLHKESGSSKNVVIGKGDKEFLFLPPEKKLARYFIAVASDIKLEKAELLGDSYLIDISETLFRQKDDHIAHLEGVVREKGAEAEGLKTGLAEKEREVGSLNETISQKHDHIAHLEGVAREKGAEAERLKAGLAEKDGRIKNLQETIDQKSTQISHAEGVAREKETEADRLKVGLAEKDGQIGNLQETINQKATQISHAEGVAREREAEVERLKAGLAEKDDQIGNLQGTINQKATQISYLVDVATRKEATLNHIYNSHGWKALLIYYRARDRVVPPNTTRRLFAKIVFEAITDPKGLLRHLKKINIRKFGYDFRHIEPIILEEKIERKISEISETNETKSINGTIHNDITRAQLEKLIFPFFEKPLVSIVIPVWNHWHYTFNCLDSILKNTNEVSYEVIVVDNGSSDETPSMLKKVRNIKTISNDINIGFVGACNTGANACNGKYILILNNDTQVTQGWLKSMVELAEKDKSIGVVGAKLIYPDGKLQEAGGIVWNDPINLAWNYGRYGDPKRWEYNYVKEVDYCSAACLLFKKELFEQVGLFDKRFTPGYCEDVDLAFSIRKLGYRVMYQPKSEVIHFEGTTAGVNILEGYKSYQVVNQKKFYEKWKSILEIEHSKNGQNVFLARDRSQKKKVILVVDHYVPTYDKDAGSLRMFNVLKILSELGHKVIFIGDNLLGSEPYTQELQQGGIEVIYAPHILSVKDYIEEFGSNFDVVILSRSHIAIKHIDIVKSHCAKAMIIYDTVDLGFLRESRRARIENNEKLLEEAEKLKSTDLYLARRSDTTLVVSPVEKALLLKENPLLNIEIVSIIHHTRKPEKSFSERNGILFVGGFDHPPNVDAVIFFVKEIFPLMIRKLPDLTFTIAGSNPPERVLALKSSHVIVTGYVKDLTSYFENSKVFIAPLRYGAGVKGKINHSMSHGLPVVTTSIGAEGIELTDGTDVLIGDEPGNFAEKVMRLYADENLWNKLSGNSMRNIEKHFSYEVAKHKLKELLEGNRIKREGNHV